MSDIYFTSDTHFNHRKCQELFRVGPFSTLDEMNETIIERWNETVKKADRVYHLGDFALGRPEDAAIIAKRLNGQIYLIRGNHEKVAEHKLVSPRFVWIKDYFGLKVGEQKIYLLHYAMRVWNCSHHGSWHLYGHSHGTLADDPRARSLDVGVDSWDFRPVSYDQVNERMGKKDWQPVDHHGSEVCDFEEDS